MFVICLFYAMASARGIGRVLRETTNGWKRGAGEERNVSRSARRNDFPTILTRARSGDLLEGNVIPGNQLRRRYEVSAGLGALLQREAHDVVGCVVEERKRARLAGQGQNL